MSLTEIAELYLDAPRCAELIGLLYSSDTTPGYRRRKRGRGFSFTDADGHPLTNQQLLQQITELTIPPAWREVWICPGLKGHILATGIDDKGRKQYIYHPKWRTIRDMLKFYRLIVFGTDLPKIRRQIDKDLQRPELDRAKVLAIMLWLLDNTYLRIGNEQYYETNESVGLTTLTDQHVIIAGSVTTLSFRGKSGKDHQITFDNPVIAELLAELRHQRGERLFRYHDNTGFHALEPADINQYLQELTGDHISAKDFRTWGGTLLAFNHLIAAERMPATKTPADDKVVVQAVDAAAQVLGNTRMVARSSYVHPDLLHLYGTKDFHRYYDGAHKLRTKAGLDKRETELLYFLERLFTDEFSLLQKKSATN